MLGKIRNIKLPFWAKLMIFLIFCSLFVVYSIRLFYIMPIDSDYSNLILEASDIIGGNVFLNGWIQTGISFLTTDLLYYIIAVLINGISYNAYVMASGLILSCMMFSTLPLSIQGGVGSISAQSGFYIWDYARFLRSLELICCAPTQVCMCGSLFPSHVFVRCTMRHVRRDITFFSASL